MAWTFKHIYDSVETNITELVRTRDISFNISGNPVGQSVELTLAVPDGWSPALGAQIVVLNNSTTVFRGWVEAMDRSDLGPVAGIENAETFRLVVSDIYARLKNTYIPAAGQTIDGHTYTTKELEKPAGLRNEINPVDPAYLNITPKNMLLWALDLIADVEGRKAHQMPIPSISGDHITNPTTQIPDGSGGYTDFKFKSCPFIADGQSYYDLLDSICQLSGLLWKVRNDLKIETWDAQNPPTGAYEIVDGDSTSGRVQEVGGSTWVPARTISANEDITQVVNRVKVVYVPDPTTGTRKSVTVQNTDSQELYGIRERRIVTDYRTRQMAEAIARRALATDSNANIRATARVRYASGVASGKKYWLHRTNHTEGGTYWRRRAYLGSVQLVFEDGVEGPVWMDLTFDHNVYQPPNFTPFVQPKTTADVPGGEPTPIIPPPPVSSAPPLLPEDGSIYITDILLRNYRFTANGYDLNGRLSAVAGYNSASRYNAPYYYWGWAGLGDNTMIFRNGPDTFTGKDGLPHSTELKYMMVAAILPPGVTTKPTAGRLYLGVNNMFPDYRQATTMSLVQLPYIPRVDLGTAPDGYIGSPLTSPALYPGEWPEADKASEYLWNYFLPSTYPAKTFELDYGINRLEIDADWMKIDFTEASTYYPGYEGQYAAFFIAQITGAVGPFGGANSGVSAVAIGSGTNVYLEDCEPMLANTGPFRNQVFRTGNFQIDRNDPTNMINTTYTLNFDPSVPQEGELYCYALAQVGGTDNWSNEQNNTVTTRILGGKGQTVFTLPTEAVAKSLSVWLFYGTVDFERSPINVTLQTDSTTGNITGFDISPAAKYGLQPKTSLWVRYEEAA